jgi:putative MATE family efflux protein
MSQPRPGHDRFEQFVRNPRRALWVLALPIMVGMSIQTLYMVVDMVFVGRISGDALTALAFNMPLLFVALGATFGLGSGVTALVAQAVGAGSRDDATRVAQHALAVGAVMVILFMVPGLLFGPEVLTALGVPAELLGDSWSYFRIIVLGFPFMIVAVFLRSILSGEGEVKVPVMIQAAATLLNIALDPLFIFTLDMGVAGAAMATVVAQVGATAALASLYLRRHDRFVQLRLEPFPLHGETIARIFAVGAPASMSFMVMSAGGAAFNRLLVEYTPAAVAAQQVGSRLDHVMVLPMVAIASSLVTLVGMFHGARRADLVQQVVRYAFGRAVAIAAVIGVAMYAAAPWVVAAFTDDSEIRRLSIAYVHIVVFTYPFVPVSMLTGRVLQGLGRGLPLLVLTLMRVLLIAVPLSAFFVYVLQYPVHFIWVSLVIGALCTAALAGAWLVATLRRVGREAIEDAAASGDGRIDEVASPA